MKLKLDKKQLSRTGRVSKRFKYTVFAFCLVYGAQLALEKGQQTFVDSLFANASAEDGEETQQGYVYNTDGEIVERRLGQRQLETKDPCLEYKPDQNGVVKSCPAVDVFGNKYLPCQESDRKANSARGEGIVCYNGVWYPYKPTKNDDEKKEVQRASWVNSNGYVEEYYLTEEACTSNLLVPGTSLLPEGVTGFFYFIFLLYLFLGISVVADIFMEAIEVITSSTKEVYVRNEKDGTTQTYQVPIWNPTIANLTLMALGSSAPEILLSVIEQLKSLGEPAGELGPASIVGSGAFNLLVISGVSILSVDEPKKIYDLGVYSCTAFFSIFAYAWMYICLEVSSKGLVTLAEAWLTLLFFFILVGLAFSFDKLQQSKDKKKLTKEELAEKHAAEVLKIKKSQLRVQAKVHGKATIINLARGKVDAQIEGIKPEEAKAMIETFKEVLQVDDLSKVTADRLLEVLEPEALLERFAAKKANKVGKNNDFISLKGAIKGQIENEPQQKIESFNEFIGFKCLHYSVTESAGVAVVTVVKRAKQQSITFGVRTVKDTAVPGSDYKEIDMRITMPAAQTEHQIEIPIIDNNEWEPDLDFLVELYEIDAPSKERLSGDDTRTRVTILDEDFPGTLGFQMTDIRVDRKQKKVDVVLKRSEGSDGRISCIVKTEPLTEKGSQEANAVELEDYLPLSEKVVFENGEMDKVVHVELVTDKQQELEGNTKKAQVEDADDQDSGDEALDVMFKVKIEKAEPLGVKISKRNTCIVTILQGEEIAKEAIQEEKLLQYFLESKEPSWGQQFKNAVMLGPQIDEEDLIVANVKLGEALLHFGLIGWKLLFAIIPPVKWYGGFPAFMVALALIGTITAIVGSVAGLLGCVVGLKPAITAITLVAIGTSLPDTFASVTAAQNSEYADSAIGNVTGSNSVNVFLGLGLPWVMSSQYMAALPKELCNVVFGTTSYPKTLMCSQASVVPAGTLGFSVMLFLMTSVVCFAVLAIRRVAIGGELGGPTVSKWVTAGICFLLWVVYIVFSILKAVEAI